MRTRQDGEAAETPRAIAERHPRGICLLRALDMYIILMRRGCVQCVLREDDPRNVAWVCQNGLAEEPFEHVDQRRLMRERVESLAPLDSVIHDHELRLRLYPRHSARRNSFLDIP